MIDDGHAVHYSAVERGTPIYGSDGKPVGEVERVLDNHREHILDGIVFRDAAGERRFVDGPEVGRTAERGVTLTITAAEAERLGPPRGNSALEAMRGGPLGRLFGG